MTLQRKGIAMSKATRILTMTGMALVAGLTFSASPAQAAPRATATPQAATQGSFRVVGYYPSRGRCERAGHIGEFLNRWDDHSCTRVRWGHHAGWYALSVDY